MYWGIGLKFHNILFCPSLYSAPCPHGSEREIRAEREEEEVRGSTRALCNWSSLRLSLATLLHCKHVMAKGRCIRLCIYIGIYVYELWRGIPSKTLSRCCYSSPAHSCAPVYWKTLNLRRTVSNSKMDSLACPIQKITLHTRYNFYIFFIICKKKNCYYYFYYASELYAKRPFVIARINVCITRLIPADVQRVNGKLKTHNVL